MITGFYREWYIDGTNYCIAITNIISINVKVDINGIETGKLKFQVPDSAIFKENKAVFRCDNIYEKHATIDQFSSVLHHNYPCVCIIDINKLKKYPYGSDAAKALYSD